LGIGTTDNETSPRLISQIEEIDDISAGERHVSFFLIGFSKISFFIEKFSHTVAVDIKGKVWVWGRNRDGQLGRGDTNSLALPHLVSFLTFYAIAKVFVRLG
jgi:alpha-tubulin suppressor-like RCC1 family protein